MIEIDVRALRDRVGEELPVGDWHVVDQTHIDRFADATGDHQWIHVDAARAAAESPFKATIAHGFLTLSLVSVLLRGTVRVGGTRMAINYGANRVRFPSAVPSGSRVRARFVPVAVEEVGDDAVQVTWKATVEREGAAKPCCVAEWIVRYYTA
jgi:acyl dehydratase